MSTKAIFAMQTKGFLQSVSLTVNPVGDHHAPEMTRRTRARVKEPLETKDDFLDHVRHILLIPLRQVFV